MCWMDEQLPKQNIRTVTQADIDRLLRELKEEIPAFDLCFKTDSWLQRLIGKLVHPFNPTYMTRYTTVMGGKIWLPSREFLRNKSLGWLYALLRHEAVHLRDMRRYPVLFQISYLLLLSSGVTCRAYWEWRAYKASIAAEFEIKGEISDEFLDGIVAQFTGPAYLYMWPFRSHIRRLAEQERARLTN